ncbi:MAG: J domain-containing protein [Dolichospermum sp.]
MQDNEDYYKLLEVSPDATFQEIKAAYRVLCKEYHPDKMPPGTPEKARKYIEERFKQLNEAYSTLSNPEERQKYDTSRYSDVSSSQGVASQEVAVNNYHTVFDSEKMQEVAKRLERLRKKIETEYQKREKEIELSVKKQLQVLGYSQEDWNRYTKKDLEGFTLEDKVKTSIFLLFIACFGLPFGVIGWLWSGFCLLVCLGAFLNPTINKKTAQQIQEIKNKADADKFNAEKKRQHELDNLEKHQRQRVSFFKSIPIEQLSEDYIAALSDEDQFYLLKAIQERKDAEKLGEHLKNAAGVVVGVGILAAIFGLGIGIGSSWFGD